MILFHMEIKRFWNTLKYWWSFFCLSYMNFKFVFHYHWEKRRKRRRPWLRGFGGQEPLGCQVLNTAAVKLVMLFTRTHLKATVATQADSSIDDLFLAIEQTSHCRKEHLALSSLLLFIFWGAATLASSRGISDSISPFQKALTVSHWPASHIH